MMPLETHLDIVADIVSIVHRCLAQYVRALVLVASLVLALQRSLSSSVLAFHSNLLSNFLNFLLFFVHPDRHGSRNSIAATVAREPLLILKATFGWRPR
jgi:hypothetical protein